MCHGRADREPVNRNGGHDAPDEVSARTNPSPTLCRPRNATALQTMRFGSVRTKGPSSNNHPKPAPTRRPTKATSTASGASPKERLVDEHGGHCVAHGQER